MEDNEVYRSLGRIEQEIKHLRCDVSSFCSIQTEKNKKYDETHEFVTGIRAKGNIFKRFLFWIVGLFVGWGRHNP